jgi:hypothetical protein
VKKYRRIEITAFRRRITIVSGQAMTANENVWLSDADSQETIEMGSDEGQRILLEAVRLLQEKLIDRKSEPPAASIRQFEKYGIND